MARPTFPLAAALLFFQLNFFAQSPLNGQRVLVFSKTAEFRHASIPAGKAAMLKLAETNHFRADTTENAAYFSEDSLKNYRLVVFLNTTGDVLTRAQQIALERFIQAGGGFVGVHSASDTEHKWPWFGRLVGGYFASHPGDNVQVGLMKNLDRTNPATSFLPDTFRRRDEFYDFYNFQKGLVHVLVEVDEKSYHDGKTGDFHPLAWCHEFDGGRAFYTNWGHTPETFSEAVFQKHLLGGMIWAASGPPVDYSRPLRSTFMPEETRFKRTVLIDHLNEPTELAVAPDGGVFFIERKGAVKYFDSKKKAVRELAQLAVFSKFEYGLMGLGLDPKFSENGFVYLYYSPDSTQADTAQRLSRFFFDRKTGVFDLKSEETILRVPVKRTECCHTGGSIDWDASGNLYLSTGDDTNPFDSRGYSPMDERDGREGWDAGATSANTDDLRGKILRIRPQPDGSYQVPDGNLFPKNTAKTRSEIYVMGNRNPYRISVDRANGWLYWGEVGPDAGEKSDTLGPRGYDEINQARAAGNFGWPLFVGDNRAYSERHWKDSTFIGQFFDPKKPVNPSPHNTGLKELPPVAPPFIFYPYDESPEFGKVVGKGGRNAMAGPVYHEADFAGLDNRFPAFFDGKLFAYDWMRGWINLVSMRQNGDFEAMERWLPNETFANPMDMAFGPDGALYLLEYGYNWFVANDEARLSRIEFVPGNREPMVEISASKTVGAAPLTVLFSSEKTFDPDGDALKFNWKIDKRRRSKKPGLSVFFKKPGTFHPTLTVRDGRGHEVSKSLTVTVGNEPPEVQIKVEGNQTFYWNGDKIVYQAHVFDMEDMAGGRKIADEEVRVTIDYLEGFDKKTVKTGHQQGASVALGRRLMDGSDCRSCHQTDAKSAGPSLVEISKKYKAEWEIEGKLAEKIIKGGSGVWGETGMSAHPQLTKSEAMAMARYIMTLADEKKANRPLAGEHVVEEKKPGTVTFSASYSDRGADFGKLKMPSQTGSASVTLRSAEMRASSFDVEENTRTGRLDSLGEAVTGLGDGAFFGFDDFDLTGLTGFSAQLSAFEEGSMGGQLEIRAGSATGPLLASGGIGRGERQLVRLPFSPPPPTTSVQLVGGDAGKGKREKLFFVFKNPAAKGKPVFAIGKLMAEKR